MRALLQVADSMQTIHKMGFSLFFSPLFLKDILLAFLKKIFKFLIILNVQKSLKELSRSFSIQRLQHRDLPLPLRVKFANQT